MISAETRPAAKARLRRSFWQCLAVGLLAALAAHLLLGVLFKPLPRPVKQQAVQLRFTIMVNPLTLADSDPYGLRFALKYGDPTLFGKPDETVGFSCYRAILKAESKCPPDLPPEPNSKFSLLQPGRFHMDFAPWSLCKAPPRNWLHFEASPKSYSKLDDIPPPALKLDAPLWLDVSCRPLAKLSDPQGEIAKALASSLKGKILLNDTVVTLRDAGPELPPEARILKSCGSTALDALALRSLSSSIDSMPSAMPKPDGANILILKWTDASQIPFFDVEAWTR